MPAIVPNDGENGAEDTELVFKLEVESKCDIFGSAVPRNFDQKTKNVKIIRARSEFPTRQFALKPLRIKACSQLQNNSNNRLTL